MKPSVASPPPNTTTPQTRLSRSYGGFPVARRERHTLGRWLPTMIVCLLLLTLGIGAVIVTTKVWQPVQTYATINPQPPGGSGASSGGFTANNPGAAGQGTPPTPAVNSAPGGASGQFGGGDLHTPVLDATAKALGITTTTLNADLAAQATIPQIAQAQHVALATVNAAYLTALKTALTQQVQAGAMSQTLADQMYQMEAQHVSQGNYFLLTLPSGGPPQAGSGFSG